MKSLILKTLPESERPWAKAFLAIEDEGPHARRLEWLIAAWIVLHGLLMWADHPGWLFGWIILYTLSQAGAFTREVRNGSQEWLFSLPPNRATIAKIRLLRFFAPLLVVTILSTISLATEAPRHVWGLVFDGAFVGEWAGFKNAWLALPLLGAATAGFIVAWILRIQHPVQVVFRWLHVFLPSSVVIALVMGMGLTNHLALALITLLLLLVACLCLYLSNQNYPQLEAFVPLLESQPRGGVSHWVWAIVIVLLLGVLFMFLLVVPGQPREVPKYPIPARVNFQSIPEVTP